MSDRADSIGLPAGAGNARSAIARPLAPTLQLRDVIAKVASAARPIIAFERMSIFLLEPDEAVRVFVIGVDGGTEFSEHVRLRRQLSETSWPTRGKPVCISDCGSELDPASEIDRPVADVGRRSVLALSLDAQGQQLGVLSFESAEPCAFTHDHAAAIMPVAGLFALAVEHDRLWAL